MHYRNGREAKNGDRIVRLTPPMSCAHGVSACGQMAMSASNSVAVSTGFSLGNPSR